MSLSNIKGRNKRNIRDENIKEQILNNIENRLSMKLQSNNEMMELMLLEKNRKISQLQDRINEKDV